MEWSEKKKSATIPRFSFSPHSTREPVRRLSVTIQMKGTEQYFPVVLFIMLYKVLLTFESVDVILSVNIQIKAIE